MTKFLLIAIGLTMGLGAKKNDAIITIVDIAKLDRNGVAKELSIINKYSPKVIGLDFLLTTDSLQKDVLLAKELSKTKHLVAATMLHNNDEKMTNRWDSLEQYHPKFRFGTSGFSNITTTDDTVIVNELPMRQYFKNDRIYAFSYMVAKMYDEERIKSKYKNDDRDFLFAEGTLGRRFKVISVKELLSGNFDKNDLKGKIVLLGHVSDSEDSFYLDETKTKKISGVELHASFIREILE